MFNAVKSTAKEDQPVESEQRRGSQQRGVWLPPLTSGFQVLILDLFGGRDELQSSQEKPEAAPKLLIRVRYTVDGKKGRRPLEVDGTPSTVSLFHFYQAESAELGDL